MSNRDLDLLIFLEIIRKWRLIILDLNGRPSTNKTKRIIHHQSSGQSTRLDKDLKTVTDTKYWQVILRHPFNFIYNGTISRYDACAKTVSVGETSGDYHSIITSNLIFCVPDIISTQI